MKIAFANDHAASEIRGDVLEFIKGLGHEVVDLGSPSADAVDYPDYASAAGRAVVEGGCDRAVTVCGTGIGISITANRHAGVRAALCHNCDSAYLSRVHNNANVIVFGARYTTFVDARAMLKIFLGTHFSEEERHIRRIEKIDQTDRKEAHEQA